MNLLALRGKSAGLKNAITWYTRNSMTTENGGKQTIVRCTML